MPGISPQPAGRNFFNAVTPWQWFSLHTTKAARDSWTSEQGEFFLNLYRDIQYSIKLQHVPDKGAEDYGHYMQELNFALDALDLVYDAPASSAKKNFADAELHIGKARDALACYIPDARDRQDHTKAIRAMNDYLDRLAKIKSQMKV